MSAVLRPLQADDRPQWQGLAEAYKAFYKTETTAAEYDAAWQRLQTQQVQGLVLAQGQQLVGLAHYLLHGSTWGERVCYLQDLFVPPVARGQGLGRCLIDAVAAAARQQGAQRYYWLTQADNATARALYDRVAEHRGFIRYDYPL
ncbi:ribosomal protein S18 acetylase RimI-like enzyme [Inhella inkyongensis]|uniref:Ribosomal protein S18 acetylase RimI-like enzyme n=1 Tax=Inhella inkyongensis TaxID=392593 RepID=A0A840S0R3_9BURK|nr:GNAT family N-acetyltransferase [Inhella inkyongensis]MBB5203102.1 ribosomal protein S18 acetylase RimI-like enzyme [Inhella inkyongensis]